MMATASIRSRSKANAFNGMLSHSRRQPSMRVHQDRMRSAHNTNPANGASSLQRQFMGEGRLLSPPRFGTRPFGAVGVWGRTYYDNIETISAGATQFSSFSTLAQPQVRHISPRSQQTLLCQSFIDHMTLNPVIQCRLFTSSSALHSPKKRKSNKGYSTKNNKDKYYTKKKKPSTEQKKYLPNRNPISQTGIPDPVELQRKQQTPQQQQVPPAYLTRTASPYAYVAKCAIMDESTGEMLVDPMTLYSELNTTTNLGKKTSSIKRNNQQRRKGAAVLPRIFKQSHLHYFPPSSFPNYEPPTDGTPEVAFLGRSNTGKSSLINALSSVILREGGGASKSVASGGGELARTSKRPGRTQTINYFGLIPNSASTASSTSSIHPNSNSFKNSDKSNKHPSINQSSLYLVDLPGFGYADAPNESVDAWQERTQQFLISRSSFPEEGERGLQPWPSPTNENQSSGSSHGHHSRASSKNLNSPPLKRLYLLLDSRLPQPTAIDLSVMGWCDDYSIPYTNVLTKVDGSSRAHCVKLTNQLCMRYHSLQHSALMEGDGEVYMDPLVYWTSAKDGLGMEELLHSVENNLISVDGGDGFGHDSLLGEDDADDYDSDELWEENEYEEDEEEVDKDYGEVVDNEDDSSDEEDGSGRKLNSLKI